MPKTKPPPDETREQRFKRLVEQRVTLALEKIRLITILSNKSVYQYSEEDVEKIFGPVEWLGNPGWYIRDLPGGKKTEQEMVFGKPKI